MKSYIPFIDYWRVAATFYLVCFHTAGLLEQKGYYIAPIFKNIFGKGYIGTSFFMVLSGFIITLIYQNKLLTKDKIYSFWIIRFFRSYITYLLLLPLGFLSTYFFGNTIELDWLVLPNILANLFVISSWLPGLLITYITPAWTLITLYLFYVIFPFIKINKEPHKTIIYLLILCFLPPLLYTISFPEGINTSQETKELFEYLHVFPPIRILEPLIGMYMAYYLSSEQPQLKYNYYNLTYYIIIFLLLLLVCIDIKPSFYPVAHNFAFLPLVMAILAIGYRRWQVDSHSMNNNHTKYLTRLANDTLGIYLCHFFLITPLYIVFYKVFSNILLAPMAIIVQSAINFLLCLLLQRTIFYRISRALYYKIVPKRFRTTKY